MPDALEFPRMLRAVIPLVRANLAGIRELVALAFRKTLRAFQFLRAAAGRVPGFAAVIGTLDDLAKPAAGLGGVESVRIRRGAFHVIDLPAREMRAADLPVFAPSIRRDNKGAFLGADEDSDFAHGI